MWVTLQSVILWVPLHIISTYQKEKIKKGKRGHKDVTRTKRSGTDSDKQFESTLKGNLVRVGVKDRVRQK